MKKVSTRAYEQNRKTYPHGLSCRQYEVMLSLYRHNGNQAAVMEELCIARSTLRTHLFAVYAALGVHTLTEAMVKFIKLESVRRKEATCQLSS